MSSFPLIHLIIWSFTCENIQEVEPDGTRLILMAGRKTMLICEDVSMWDSE